ncbi:MAG: phosphoglucosamine mutase [Thermoanaerobaculia bacterium]
MRHLFGTDGIRGEAGVAPLNDSTVSQIGGALVNSLGKAGFAAPVQIALGCDTRESSEGIAAAFAGGVIAAGGRLSYAGVVPTPGIAFLVQSLGAAAGVVISASHNPWQDNGVKIFSSLGRKLPDEVEIEIEREIKVTTPARSMALTADPNLSRSYLDHLVSTLPHRLDSLTVVIDGANGAAYSIGPEAFHAAGANVVSLHVAPNGRNINENSGALHPLAMVQKVKAIGADFGIALDGDADRIVVADAHGTVLDGDDILYLWTLELEREGRKPEVVVGTVMSNWSLEEALNARGIRLIRAAVGDRYVVDEMQREGALLGGEPSGHLIRSDLTTTGDGVLTGLHIAALIAASGQPLHAQPRLIHTPQILLNVRVKSRIPFEAIPGLQNEKERCEKMLDGHGRILLRYSGTEALARVMVEGSEAALVRTVAGSLAQTIKDAIGAS